MRNASLPEGKKFLRELARLPVDTYEFYFSRCANELGLGFVLDRNDLRLLFEASFSATSCNLTLNESCACLTQPIKQEIIRRRLEQEFMVAREVFFASPGWQNLPAPKRALVRERFLRVSVRDDLLAW
jgi:hypothetical protein